MTNFLIVMYFLVGIVFGGSGLLVYFMLARLRQIVPGHTATERVKREEAIVKAEEHRKKMLPWVLLSFVAWPINVTHSLIRRMIHGKAAS